MVVQKKYSLKNRLCMKPSFKKLLILLLTSVVYTANAQKFMVVGQKGGVTTNFPIENVDSVYFIGFDNENGDNTYVSVSDKYISSFSDGTKFTCENFLYKNNILYAVGSFGIYKIDYSNPESPSLLLRNRIKDGMLAKSVQCVDDYLYVTLRQNTAGTVESVTPQIRLDFENGVEEYIDLKNGNITNNDLLNKFFKSLTLVSIDPTIIDKIIIYKAKPYNGMYRNTILIAQSGGTSINFASANYATREEALASLSSEYTNSRGNTCEVDWDVLPEGSTDFSNIVLNVSNLGQFDSYYHTDNAKIDELGIQSPNRWTHSARFSTMIDGGTAMLKKNLGEIYDEGFVSFWMNVENVITKDVDMPILTSNNKNLLSIRLIPMGNKEYKINLLVNENEYQSLHTIKYKEWYNIKVHINNNVAELLYSEKELEEWIPIVNAKINENVGFDNLCVGFSTSNIGMLIYIDDVYFNPTNIDDVSYLNGGIAVLKAEDLSVIHYYNSDLKATQSFVKDNLLFVDYLTGINVYDISIPESLKLASYYRSQTFKEYQGCDYYTLNGKTYAITANYALGFSIFDITDPYNTFLIKEIIFDKNQLWSYYNGFLRFKIWDVAINYPYAYFAAAPNPEVMGTDGEFRGIITYNLSDLNNSEPQLAPIPSEAYWQLTSNADRQPTHIEKYQKHLFLNNEERGFVVYDISNGLPKYIENVETPGTSCVYSIRATESGKLFIGDGHSGNKVYNDYNIYMYNLNSK